MIKELRITNQKDVYSVFCDGAIRTRVSEACIQNFSERVYKTPERIVLEVLLNECNLSEENPNDWELLNCDTFESVTEDQVS